jgi:hypothetical protein
VADEGSAWRTVHLRGYGVGKVVSTRALTLLHRSLGVAFCLFFTIWFASGIVMHFVPFARLTEAERLAGLSLLGGDAFSLCAAL